VEGGGSIFKTFWLRRYKGTFSIESSSAVVFPKQKKPNPISHLVNRVRVREQTRRREIPPQRFSLRIADANAPATWEAKSVEVRFRILSDTFYT